MLLLRSGFTLLCVVMIAASAGAQPAPSPTPATPLTPPAIPPAPPPLAPPVTPPTGDNTKPPPLPEFRSEPDLEPHVTIIRRETDTVEEVRVNGELRYLKVTPRFGKPYYLVPNTNGQTYLRYDSLDFGLKPPMWLLFSW
jgi:hypothetical protein